MVYSVVGSTGEGTYSHVRPSTLNVLVVTMVLCEGLLHNGNPERIVSAALGEDKVISIDGKPVIDDYGVRNTKGVKVDTVDTVFGKLVAFVQEDPLNTPGILSESGSGRQEPAVSEVALANIAGPNTGFSE